MSNNKSNLHSLPLSERERQSNQDRRSGRGIVSLFQLELEWKNKIVLTICCFNNIYIEHGNTMMCCLISKQHINIVKKSCNILFSFCWTSFSLHIHITKWTQSYSLRNTWSPPGQQRFESGPALAKINLIERLSPIIRSGDGISCWVRFDKQ